MKILALDISDDFSMLMVVTFAHSSHKSQLNTSSCFLAAEARSPTAQATKERILKLNQMGFYLHTGRIESRGHAAMLKFGCAVPVNSKTFREGRCLKVTTCASIH